MRAARRCGRDGRPLSLTLYPHRRYAGRGDRRSVAAAARFASGLRGEEVDLFDFRSFGEELGGLRHQRGGDAAVEVRLAAALGLERVEDPEGGGAEAQRVPDGGLALLARERECALQQLGDL